MCFAINGGSKGDCPACCRPVLILKSEGGFVEASGNVWHKRCFRCSGCQRNIGDTPMVDLLGRPSCADCFDTCLKRSTTPRKPTETFNLDKGEKRLSTVLQVDSKSQQGSPAMDESGQRLGIMKIKEGSPVLEELTQRLNAVFNRTPQDNSPAVTSTHRPLDSHDCSPITQRTLGKGRFSACTSPSLRNGSALPIKADSPYRNRQVVAAADTTPSRLTYERRGTPERNHIPSLGRPSLDAIEEMKRRFMNSASPTSSESHSTPSRIPRISALANGSPALRHVVSTSSMRSARLSWTPTTPDLVPDVSDTMTQSSGPSSPPAFSPRIHSNDDLGTENKESTPIKYTPHVHPDLTGNAASRRKDSLRRLSIPAATLSPGSLCAKCGGSLFAREGAGKFVTVPEPNVVGPPKTYHTECFRCAICDGPFKESASGKAVFVRNEGGACHLECAPPEQVHTKSTVISSPIKSAFADSQPATLSPLAPVTNITPMSGRSILNNSAPTQERGSPSIHNSPTISSRYERVPSSTPAVSTPPTRFGSSTACPGCLKAVSPMEFGVVPGPQGSRWHATCLVCGGKGASKARKDKSQPGCGKKLDSAAKRDVEGGVWCRECLLLLPGQLRNPPTEKPIVPTLTGRSTGGGPFSKSVTPQLTGTTTIARQFTGLRGGDAALMRQLTGGSLSPTRQLAGSPTKQLGTPRPRPKSVIGMRSGKSVDEGRGMFLVRQMTGSGSSGV
ncbi:hypothetical protein ID866_601 [Astraeus odoratus]|nr:hypothetical protein ID866_601 [Astraeus odoratus]